MALAVAAEDGASADEVSRLSEAGAVHAGPGALLADPEGNEFAVVDRADAEA